MVDKGFRLIDLIDDMYAGKDVFFRGTRVAKDVMTSSVKTLTLDDTVGTCYKLMIDNEIRHVPVMDFPTGKEGKPYLIGVVSERDIFRQISPYVGKIGERDTDQKALRQPLGKILSRNPKCVSVQTPVSGALQTMVDNHIDMVPILAEGRLEGIVTAYDVIKLFAKLGTIRSLCTERQKRPGVRQLASGDPGEAAAFLSSVLQTAQDIMTEPVICLTPKDNIAKAVRVMQKKKLRHLPIVNTQGRLMGIVSDRDILLHLSFLSTPPRLPDVPGFRQRLFTVEPNDKGVKMPLNQILTLKVVSVLPDSNIYDVAKTLHDNRIGCVPVVDKEEKLRGIVTVMDLIYTLLAAYKVTEKREP